LTRFQSPRESVMEDAVDDERSGPIRQARGMGWQELA
jgi:hypothetical protein